ncbi:MAG: PAS domain S-box protein [Verrucomicrobia bacterium]|nr:PAS domain S-box protein [Verrucomicrobiota bacterium]
MNILIVDDIAQNRKLLRAQLEAEKFTAFEAADGWEALAVLDREKIDAIISDILMPKMDGYRLCFEVRRSKQLREIPFIFYTATYTSPGDEKLCLDLGADKYVRKPASVAVILAALHEVTNGGARRAPRPSVSLEETDVLKEYSERLVRKLEQKNVELALHATALEVAANAIIITDRAGAILWANPAFTTLTGYTAEEVLGKTPRVLKSGQHGQAFYKDLWQTILSGQTWRGEFINRRKDGRLFYDEHTITPVRSNGAITHFIGIMHDVTERKQAEIHIQHLNRVYAVLSDFNHTIVHVREPQKMFEAACRIAVEQGGFRLAWIGLVDSTRKSLKPVAHAGVTDGYLEKLKVVLGDDPHGRGPTATALRDGTHVVCNDLEHDPRLTPWQADARQLGYRALAVLPLTVGGEKVGTFNLYASEPGFFDDAEMRLLDELAMDIGFALEMSQQEAKRQRAEEALKLFRALVDQSNDTIEVVDPQTGRFLDVNEKGHLALGYSREEFLALSVFDLDPTVDPAAFPRVVEELRKSGVLRREGSHRRKDGSTFPVEVSIKYVRLDRDYAVAVVRDITERKRAEAALRESEDRYRSLVEESPDAIGIYQDDKLIFINATGARQLGAKSKEELLDRKNEQIIHPDDLPAALDRIRRRLAGETGMYPAEVRYLRLDGTTLPVEVIATPITFGGKAAVQFIARDITERRQAEQHLRESETLYHSLVEHLPQHVFRKDRAGRFTFGNGLFCKSLGKPLAEILGKTDLDFCPAELAAKYQQDDQRVIQTGQSFEGEEEHRQANGKKIIVNVVKTPLRAAAGQIIGVQGIAWDITEKKQLEAQMLRTQRLESIGTLAGGVAHDLNNALAPILMATELLRLEFPDTATSYLELIQSSAKRGADMVKQLLTFAKGVEGERLLVQPKHLLKEMEKLIRSTFPKNLELRADYAKDLRTILGDATQLLQVLLNLCVNARDAMPEGGTLTLKAENLELDAVQAGTILQAKPGHYVVWRVTDTGTGIPPEIQEHIFEPFFSTKGPDKGTGLGLSTVIGIVKSHGGFVQVYSTPGQGSTFAVYLPAYGYGKGDTSLLTKIETTFRGHGETILVVDDEVTVRNVLRAVLTKLNFKVLSAPDGTSALLQVTEQQGQLRAVITDLHMPGMDGLAFVRVLKGRFPQAGIIVASGRLDEREANQFKQLGVNAVLDKPFTQDKLVEALKTVFQK